MQIQTQVTNKNTVSTIRKTKVSKRTEKTRLVYLLVLVLQELSLLRKCGNYFTPLYFQDI